ncbi:protocatechuate 3,4-dioxygenase subunit alpha [Phaeobacter sp. BS52]|uniref:Protocatechuate 3,4-dioxygenase alpha chain n=1 Tax=Phaeobacter piscinae TaxID=1580596 RepID=A0AAN1L998_9RHOB|nr:protocatechuate 3,4-dioxygenase subunit alpha [Phaeobacter piscinae]ATG42134.1 protocatechuate 3,4-dioxygenase alpha chain [Phaeobacter piscinae]AUR34467.1 protocatechuate 3,4-dioxygenase alpha chain [Phaeobacter piscinae]
MTSLKETPSQTAGPYVHIGLAPGAAGFDIYETELGQDIAGPEAKGQRIRIEGRVLDGTGAPLKDVLIEVWQANAKGIYAHRETPQPEGKQQQVEAGFQGWGRVISDFDTGDWQFETVKPGPVRGRDGQMMAPHINLWIVARGINVGLNTRLYFEEEQEANRNDPVLKLIEQTARRSTLLARRKGQADTGTAATPLVYRFDIHLQGPDETVFFDI